MAVVYRHIEDRGSKYLVRSRCLRCGELIISIAMHDFCLDCSLKMRENARDDGELPQNPCK